MDELKNMYNGASIQGTSWGGYLFLVLFSEVTNVLHWTLVNLDPVTPKPHKFEVQGHKLNKF